MFDFDLQLSDGTVVTESVAALNWEWHRAFSAACMTVEERFGLPPRSGIRCTAYRWNPLR